ncbi:zinc finger MYM-type protein 1-like, partial [Aphis craccivora]
MLSVHRERVNKSKEKFIEQLITSFAIEQPRRLHIPSAMRCSTFAADEPPNEGLW